MKRVMTLALMVGVILLAGGSRATAVETDAAVIEEQLEKPIAAEFTETALQDVLNYLSETLDVQFHVKQRVLMEAGIESTAITMNLKDVHAKTVLDLALQDVSSQLDYEVRDGFVLISTKEDLDSLTVVRVYNCRDLLLAAPKKDFSAAAAAPGIISGPMPSGPMGGGFVGPGMGGGLVVVNDTPASQLVSLLQSAVEPDTWDVSAGAGNVSEFNGLLVVKHSARVHAKVAELLEMLREAAEKTEAAPPTEQPRERP